MKNGVNVAAISELVHEIRDTPREGDAYYGVLGKWEHGVRCSVDAETMLFGTKRHVRDFQLACDLPPILLGNGSSPSPWEYALAALGSCAMTVIIQGASYKGLTLSQLRIKAAAKLPAPSADAAHDGVHPALEDITLAVSMCGEATEEDGQELLNKVRTFSPNFMTFSDPTPVNLTVGYLPRGSDGIEREIADGKPVTISMTSRPLELDPDRQDCRRIDCHVTLMWRYAVQIDAESGTQICVINEEPQSSQYYFAVDQPSVVGGLDESPNPQEYLLSALASDLIQRFLFICDLEKIRICAVSVKAKGHIDMRGLLNVGGAVGIKLQNIVCDIRADTVVELPQLAELCHRAARMSVVCNTIIEPCNINLVLVGSSKQNASFCALRRIDKSGRGKETSSDDDFGTGLGNE